ncbi:DUF3891 family protein [Microcoleus sp. FACHB-831]|nr:DUF3891 family protein [Microcoleus sp. FACHB-831]
MLHRLDSEGLICITQPAHAWVAGCLARAWGNEQFGYFAPTEEVLLGAEQHDVGWLSWEQSPTLNAKTGYPHKFMEVAPSVHTKLWSNAKNLTLPIGRYATLLVSLHGTGLYERFRSWEKYPESNKVVQDFLKDEYTFQEKLIANLQEDSYYKPHTTPDAIKRNRSLVATWDALSLAVCHKVHNEQHIDNVPTAQGETTLTLKPIDNNPNQISVSPWPFQQTKVTLTYEGRLLHSTFTDEEAMRSALVNSRWVTITNTLIPR